ncbi:MAG: deoxyribonuclease I [Planctomycetota bacterium]
MEPLGPDPTACRDVHCPIVGSRFTSIDRLERCKTMVWSRWTRRIVRSMRLGSSNVLGVEIVTDSDRGHPIQLGVIVLLLAAGGWWFFQNYEVSGLDAVSVSAKSDESEDDSTFISYQDEPPALSSGDLGLSSSFAGGSDNPFSASRSRTRQVQPTDGVETRKMHPPIRVASWALDGFGPTKLRNPVCRKYVTRVIEKFDVIALQQIASIERDLIPRLVDTLNRSGRRYDFVVSKSTGPSDRLEQLAFVFDTQRVVVDRRQTYTVEDPSNEMTFDPLVGCFRAVGPSASEAWTFSLVNVRIDLARAPQEVALLPSMLKAISNDGRGEDDLLIAGLFQADDAYLLGTLTHADMKATVESRPTDIFGRYQTSNLLFRDSSTTEFVGRGGAFEWLRSFELNAAEAESVTSHLPVYGEFSASEGGHFE